MAFNLAEEHLAQTEEELGLRLPSDYREAMKKSNGGEVITGEMDWELYPIRDTSDRKRLSRTCNHIMSETISCQEFEAFPKNALAIGSNGSGDQLVFLKASEAYEDTVYIWYHETGEIKQFASSFSEIKQS